METSPVLVSKKAKRGLRKNVKSCQKLKFDSELLASKAQADIAANNAMEMPEELFIAEQKDVLLQNVDLLEEMERNREEASRLLSKSFGAPELSLTQVFCESGISNSQLASSMDDIIDSIVTTTNNDKKNDLESEFKGFDKTELETINRKRLVYLEIEKQLIMITRKRKISAYETNNLKYKRIKYNDKNQQFVDENIESLIALKSRESFSTKLSNKELSNNDNLTELETIGFSSASGKAVKTSTNNIEKAEALFGDLKSDIESEIGFSSAAGRAIKTSIDSLNKAGNLFQNCDDAKCKSNNTEFSLASTKDNGGFCSASGKTITASKSVLAKAEKLFEEDTDNKENGSLGFTSASGKQLSPKKSTIEAAERMFANLNDATSQSSTLRDSTSNKRFNLACGQSSSNSMDFSFGNSASKKTRRLGVSGYKQLSTNSANLLKAQRIFEDILSPVATTSNSKPFSSTPIKADAMPLKKKLLPFSDTTITPIKATDQCSSISNISDLVDSTVTYSFSKTLESTVYKEQRQRNFLLEKPAQFQINDMINEFKKEKKELMEKLHILDQKIQNISILNENLNSSFKKARFYGHLYIKKMDKSRQKKSLQEFVNYSRPGKNVSSNNINYSLFEITPANAIDVHFISEKVILTEDGATLIPTPKNTIGLPQIELAFKALPHVDATLLHPNWIRNHYKWIIWKLASYERMFPATFQNTFSASYVIDQLKYRYDREIERAERPAIRKICETDDLPQRRLVLCIADIIKQQNEINFELTDGWYSIRAKIDTPLSKQVQNGNIRIGMKLVICNAEINNLKGSHPLDLPDLVHLKLNFNCTRRALWHSKLGYQQCHLPFPLRIRSLNNGGGNIGRIQFFIAKMYPLKYHDKDNANVWRNERAEEQSIQKWQKEHRKKINEIQEKVCEEMQTEQAKYSKCDKSNISEIYCPDTLLYLIESSRDPESIMENLSASQKQLLQTHQGNQSYFQSKFDKYMLDVSPKNRNVVPLLEIGIVDMLSNDNKIYSLNIWRANDNHLDMFKEGSFFNGYYLCPKLPYGLNSTVKSTFEKIDPPTNASDFSKFLRKLVPIKDIQNATLTFTSNEFDTIGLVVTINISDQMQQVWLTDLECNLLLITILMGPQFYLMPHNVKRGQPVIVCNLKNPMWRKQKYIETNADLRSSIMINTQIKHIKNAFESFCDNLPKNINDLLSNCDKEINSFGMNFLDDTVIGNEEAAFNNNCLTTTDIALSLIDLDKFK